MTILLTGGTGKTGIPTARRIAERSTQTVVLASRKGTVPEQLSGPDYVKVRAVKFDWFDPASWENPFNYVASEMLSRIDKIYLVAPMAWDVTLMNDFIDFAHEKGVNKFLLLSASQSKAGGPSLGQVHAHLKKVGAQKHPFSEGPGFLQTPGIASAPNEIQWMIIRPTWFIENLGEYQVDSIRDEDTIYSVWRDGRVPFVSAEDIGELAYDLLANWEYRQKRWNTDMIIHGPMLFNNDQLAQLLSEVLGRTITHTRITREQYVDQWKSIGLEEFALGIVDGELQVAEGSEEAIFQRAGAVRGKVQLRDYVEKNKHLWMKPLDSTTT